MEYYRRLSLYRISTFLLCARACACVYNVKRRPIRMYDEFVQFPMYVYIYKYILVV